MPFVLDSFGADLQALSKFEELGAMVPCTPDPNLKHQKVCPFHEMGNCPCSKGIPLCQVPGKDHGRSLSGEVNCTQCRDLWHFAVSPANHLEKMHSGAVCDYYLKLLDAQACNCYCCRDWIRSLLV